jgi:hypothetical protein
MRQTLAAATLWLTLCATASAQTLGLVGDSGTDEFQAEDQRGGSYGDTTFNWVELLTRLRGVNLGAWGSRAEPRRTGYAFDWARSGATACDVVTGGQASGLQAQIAAGQVAWVATMFGANDFALWNGTYQDIYSGALSGAALQAKIDGIVACSAQVVEAVSGVGAGHAFIGNIADVGSSPSLQAQFPNAVNRKRVSDAIAAVNVGIAAEVAARGMTLLDLNQVSGELLSRLDANGNLVVGGELISATTPGDEPHHMLLGDDNHAGTVTNGLIANVFLGPMNVAGFGVAPFLDEELLVAAGIHQAPPIVDSTSPLVALTSPAADATLTAGTSVSLAANASDNLGVAGVQFTVDGALVGDDTTAPYSRSWTVTVGSHAITAVARDAAGNTALATILVTGVAPPPPPQTVLPTAASVTVGSLVSGTLSSLQSNNNQFYVVRSTTSGSARESRTTVTFAGFTGAPQRLDVSATVKAFYAGERLGLSLWNFSTGQWVQFLYTGSLGTAEVTKTFAVSSGASAYVSGGQARVQLRSDYGSVTHRLSIEMVTVKATY